MNLLPLLKISGLFHDFGKATSLFQKKITATNKIVEPFRHEYVSAVMFSHFVYYCGNTDEGWIESLKGLNETTAKKISEHITEQLKENQELSFSKIPPLARMVGWLVLSHHLMPVNNEQKAIYSYDALFTINKNWFKRNEDNIAKNFEVKTTPFSSSAWCNAAKEAANNLDYTQTEIKMFTYHQLRMMLMWADHYYSSIPPEVYGDAGYKLFANTKLVRNKKVLNQRLDNHLIGVAKYSNIIYNNLENNLKNLKTTNIQSLLVERTELENFKWQNNLDVIEPSKNPTFTIMLASTGRGKTLGNIKVMGRLSDGELRLTTALGLRTLTKQTGFSYQERMKLGDLSILIGGRNISETNPNEKYGSESLFEDSVEVISNQRVELDWLLNNKMKEQIVESPVVVCTLDHIIAASEGINGGRNIISMLRLMSSDIILDEIDDYTLEDMYAVSRLVYLVGACKRNLLISSATLAPALVEGLFEAYYKGVHDHGLDVDCYWIDEFEIKKETAQKLNQFANNHLEFVKKRFETLSAMPKKHWGEIVNVDITDSGWSVDYAKTILEETKRKHNDWHESFNDKKISFGLIRFANINPMISVIRDFCQLDFGEYTIYICPYHSRFTDLQRSSIEKTLDSVLYRKDLSAAYRHPHIAERINKAQHKNIIFLVFGTPVVEVGRDHSYSWMTGEFSSVRAAVQCAGRIQRHQTIVPHAPNVSFFNLNIRAMKNDTICFERPGFERNNISLASHDLNDIIDSVVYEKLDSRYKILEPDVLRPEENVVDLEHYRIRDMMLKQVDGNIQTPALSWLSNNNSLVAHSVLRFPFRRGEETIDFDVVAGDFYRNGSLQNDYFSRVDFDFEQLWGMEDGINDGRLTLQKKDEWMYHNKLGFFSC